PASHGYVSHIRGQAPNLWPNRPGRKSFTARRGSRPVIHSVIRRAVMGASRIPLRKCPVATKSPSTPGHGPSTGRLSGAHGRNPHQARAIGHFRNGILLRSEEHTSELQSRGHLVCRL